MPPEEPDDLAVEVAQIPSCLLSRPSDAPRMLQTSAKTAGVESGPTARFLGLIKGEGWNDCGQNILIVDQRSCTLWVQLEDLGQFLPVEIEDPVRACQ